MGKVKAKIEKWVDVAVTDLVEADWNYKNDDEFSAKQLLANIKRNGQLETIIVRPIGDGKYEVVNGNHRLRAFLELAFETVHVCNVGDVSLRHAKRIAVETNETRFTNNEAMLSNTLKDISFEFSLPDMASTIPMTSDILEDKIASAGFSFEDFNKNKDTNGLTDKPLPGGEEFRTVSLRLPEGVADQLEAQITRFKEALHPLEDPAQCSPVMAVEAMVQHLSQVPDDQLL